MIIILNLKNYKRGGFMGLKKDCFAYVETSKGSSVCSCLTKIDCDKCSFYNNKTTRAQLEEDVKKYSDKDKEWL